jgi:predicted outer membrane repeat protein
LCLQTLERRLVPATFHATDGQSLTAAVQQADAAGGSSLIILDQAGNYDLSAALSVTADITIRGQLGSPGSFVIEPTAGTTDRLFTVSGVHTFNLQGLTLQGGTTSGDGGAVDETTAGDQLVLTNTIIKHNTSGGSGGAINIADGAALTVTGSVFQNNTAAGSGGAIAFTSASQAATVSITASGFGNNQAGPAFSSDGGGIVVIASTSIAGQSAAPSGGRPPQITMSLTGGVFSDNVAGGNGGGVWASNVASVTIRSVYATRNSSFSAAGAIGDSVTNLNGASFTFTGNSVIANYVTGPGSTTTPDGGGVFFDFQAGANAPAPTGSVNAEVDSNVLVNNSVAGAGGALFLSDEATQTAFTANVLSNIVVGNRAHLSSNDPQNNSGDGGAFYLRASGHTNRLTADGNYLVSNGAERNGGAVYLRIDSGTASVSRDIINGNHASVNGGGIDLAGNVAANARGGTVTVFGDLIALDSAGTDGGGLSIETTAIANLTGDYIVRNSSATSGGGVENFGGAVTMRTSVVIQNSAPSGPNFAGPFTDLGGNTVG